MRHRECAVAVGYDRIAHSGVDHKAGDVSVAHLKSQLGILVQLEKLAVGQGRGDELRLDRTLLGSDLEAGERFLARVGVHLVGGHNKVLHARLVERREIYDLSALRSVRKSGDPQIDLPCLDRGDNAVKAHVYDLQLHAESVGDLLGEEHIAADEVRVQILELVRSVLSLGSDNELARRLDLGQDRSVGSGFRRSFGRRGGLGAAAREQGYQQHEAEHQSR